MYPDSNYLGGIGISSFILPLIFFIFYAYCQYILSKKMEIEHSWFAFIPIFSWLNKLSIAGKSFWWGILWLLFPVLILPITLIILMMNAGLKEGLSPEQSIFAAIAIPMSFILWTIGYIKLNHGISKRTGHGGWWTVGLLFAGFIIFPVTAFHYEKGDDTNPRPLTGGKKALVIIAALIISLLFLLRIIAAAFLLVRFVI